MGSIVAMASKPKGRESAKQNAEPGSDGTLILASVIVHPPGRLSYRSSSLSVGAASQAPVIARRTALAIAARRQNGLQIARPTDGAGAGQPPRTDTRRSGQGWAGRKGPPREQVPRRSPLRDERYDRDAGHQGRNCSSREEERLPVDPCIQMSIRIHGPLMDESPPRPRP